MNYELYQNTNFHAHILHAVVRTVDLVGIINSDMKK